MTFLRKIEGEWFVCRANHSHGGRLKQECANIRDFFLPRWNSGCGYIELNNLKIPVKLMGKRLRFKVEIIEDKK